MKGKAVYECRPLYCVNELLDGLTDDQSLSRILTVFTDNISSKEYTCSCS